MVMGSSRQICIDGVWGIAPCSLLVASRAPWHRFGLLIAPVRCFPLALLLRAGVSWPRCRSEIATVREMYAREEPF